MAVLNQRVQGFKRLLDRRGRVEAVDLVEVDIVRLQPLQAGLAFAEDVAAGCAAGVRREVYFKKDSCTNLVRVFVQYICIHMFTCIS